MLFTVLLPCVATFFVHIEPLRGSLGGQMSLVPEQFGASRRTHNNSTLFPRTPGDSLPPLDFSIRSFPCLSPKETPPFPYPSLRARNQHRGSANSNQGWGHSSFPTWSRRCARRSSPLALQRLRELQPGVLPQTSGTLIEELVFSPMAGQNIGHLGPFPGRGDPLAPERRCLSR